MSLPNVDQAPRDPTHPNQPVSRSDQPVSGAGAFDAAVAEANEASAATPAPRSRPAGITSPTQPSLPTNPAAAMLATPAPIKRTAQPANRTTAASLNAKQRARYLDQISGSMKTAHERAKQQLEPLTSDRNTWLGRDVRDMVASIDRKIADFDAHRQDAIADRRQMDAQIARARAVESEMRSLGERIQTRAREFKEKTGDLFDRTVRADLKTGPLETKQGILSRFFFRESNARERERARVLANEKVPNLDATKRAYLDAKARRAPQAEIDRALDAYYGAAVDAFNYARQSGQEALAATQNGVRNVERALAAVRFTRDGSFAVGAMLIPGAQGVGVGSGLAAVGALGLMKTGTQLFDEKPGGGSWTPGSAGKTLVTNTAHLGVDAISGFGYGQLGKKIVLAANVVETSGLIVKAGALGMGSGAAHRFIDGQGMEALDPKKVVVDTIIGAGSFGLAAKIAPTMPNITPLARHMANTVLGGATGSGAQVVSNVVEGRPPLDNVGPATLLGAGTSLVAGLAMGRQITANEEAAMPDPAGAKAVRRGLPEPVTEEPRAPDTKGELPNSRDKQIARDPVDVHERVKKFGDAYKDLPEKKSTGEPLTPAEKEAIMDYTDDGFVRLNTALREGVLTERQRGMAEHIRNAMEKLSGYKGITYRKTDLSPDYDYAATLKPGMIVSRRAFTSASTDPELFSGDYLYVIHGSGGVKLNNLAYRPNEKEVLFKDGTRFEILSVEDGGPSYKKIITLKEVP